MRHAIQDCSDPCIYFFVQGSYSLSALNITFFFLKSHPVANSVAVSAIFYQSKALE